MEISSKQALRIVVKDFTGNLIAIIDDSGSRGDTDGACGIERGNGGGEQWIAQ